MNRKFNNKSITEDVLKGISLIGKVAIVTGCTSGIGYETARALATHGANVTIIARSAEKGQKAITELKKTTGKIFEYGILELDKVPSIRKFAQDWLNKHNKLDILINNAGIMGTPHILTDEGYELQFATNHLGHFLLTNLLAPTLEKGEGARVINLSSNAHHVCPVDFKDINFTNKKYSTIQAYGQSKIANIWFTNEFDRKFKNKGIRSFSMHPGGIGTNLGRYLTEETMDEVMVEVRRLKSSAPSKSIPQGAATSCWAATSPELDGKGGLYLLNSHIATAGTNVDECYVSYAYDEQSEKTLWKVSNEMLGTNF